ncbi:hypothetical protein [Lacimicrobium sp. SS2-24]|uniref:tetratricopeptide repeat protein n=1 Tax=Lacimicrobium sp. SS2-24 TaxID=2005569 RepID=UPI000B4B69F7|nr:hypothetical protein [Lacimicrobium sp. SS2-24]
MNPFYAKFIIGLMGLSLLWGCASAPSPEVAEEQITPMPRFEIFEPVENIPQVEDIFYLTPAQKHDFLVYYNDPRYSHVPRHRRVFQYLERKLHGFNYKGDTLVAQDAVDTNSGNCLSLAIMTTAFTELTDIEFEYQRVNAAPVYRLENNLITVSHHVRTILYDPDFVPEQNLIYVSKPALIIDYFPRRGDRYGTKVDRQNFISMYYRNLAANALTEGNLALANGLIHKGLEFAPLDPHSLNTLAVVYRRAGREDLAAHIYEYAMNYAPESLDLLDNYRHLLRRQNRIAEAEKIESKLGDVDENNPFKFLQLAEQAFSNQKYALAVRLFRKAERIAPYMEQPHLGLARSYFRLGKTESAVGAMENAIQATYTDETRDLYYAKLNSLQATKE